MRSMVNTISRFGRSLQFTKRLYISIGIAILLFTSVTAFQWSGYKAEWNTAVKNYAAEIKAREKAIVKIEAEAKASEEKKVQEAEMCKKHLKEHNLMAALNECHDEQNSITPKISIPYPPVKVEPFWKYNFNEHLAPVAGDSIAFAVALFVLLTIISKYQNEKSFGWKRLSLVLSALISMLIHFYLYDDYSYRSVIVSYPISVLTLLYAKIIYCWIKDGFTLDRGPSNSTVTQSPIVKSQSIQEQVNQIEIDETKNLLRGPMNTSRDELKNNYESQETTELIDRYINDDLTDLAHEVLSECLTSRGEQLKILDARKVKQSPHLKLEIARGEYSMFNFRRRSTWLAFIVGFPFYLYFYSNGWKIGWALMVTVLPLWIIFMIIERIMNKKKVLSLSDLELMNIIDEKAGELGYESQKFASDELKRRSSTK